MRVQNEEIGEDQYSSLSNRQPFQLSFRYFFFFFFNVGVRASLRVPRLIPRALKLTTL